jgi:hypothetical protein
LVGLYDSEAPFGRLDATEGGMAIGDAYPLPHLFLLPEGGEISLAATAERRGDHVGRPSSPEGAWAKLAGYEVLTADAGWLVTLYWESLAAAPGDLTVFVHVAVDGNGEPMTGDSPPMGGEYPTSEWQPGDVVRDEHLVPYPQSWPSSLAGPAGRPALSVGMYYAADGTREPVFSADGGRWPDDAIELGAVSLP